MHAYSVFFFFPNETISLLYIININIKNHLKKRKLKYEVICELFMVLLASIEAPNFSCNVRSNSNYYIFSIGYLRKKASQEKNRSNLF